MDLMTEASAAGDHPFKEPKSKADSKESSKVLPVLALNEIYIGESLSSRVSYLEMQVRLPLFIKDPVVDKYT